MPAPTPYHPDEDDWTESPSTGFMPKYVLGLAIPLALASFGAWCVIMQRAWLRSEHGTMTLGGSDAIALGIATIALAGFLHSHYFWGNVFAYGNVPMVIGKVLSL